MCISWRGRCCFRTRTQAWRARTVAVRRVTSRAGTNTEPRSWPDGHCLEGTELRPVHTSSACALSFPSRALSAQAWCARIVAVRRATARAGTNTEPHSWADGHCPEGTELPRVHTSPACVYPLGRSAHSSPKRRHHTGLTEPPRSLAGFCAETHRNIGVEVPSQSTNGPVRRAWY